MPFSPATVANYFLERASASGQPLTPMQVIKLTYIAHGWHLGYFNAPLIGERVEAWRYGPVIDSLYHSLKRYGNSAVQAFLPAPIDEDARLRVTGNTANLLDHVWQRYGRLSGPQLSTLTHQPNTPWSQVWNAAGPFARSEPISDELIQQHYQQMISGEVAA